MSEQEQNNTMEDISQQAEKSADVMSLKKVAMTVADYDRYSGLDPDDLQVTDLLGQYDIAPGERIIVSATDTENPQRGFDRVVVAGGPNSFDTDRASTDRLIDLRDADGVIAESTPERAERIVSSNDIKELGETALDAVEIARPQDDEFNYDQLFDPNYDSGLSEAEAIEAARVDNTPESEEFKREKLDYSVNRLEDAARFDKDILMVIAAVYEEAGVAMPVDKVGLIEHIRDNEQIRAGVKNYLAQKAEYYRSDLPDRPRGYSNKTPNYPGAKADKSLNVAVEYATRMLAGEWDWKREDGTIEYDVGGSVVVGQHREAARIILQSPDFLDR